MDPAHRSLTAFVRRESGVTLVELIVTMGLMFIVIAAITTGFVSGTRSENAASNRVRSQSDARLALSKMREDMHCAFAVQSVSPNGAGGFSLSLSEFFNKCAAVDQVSGSGSQVYLEWCTIPDPKKAGVFRLYRENTTCDTSGTLMATDIVSPPTGWPANTSVTPTPGSWNGNLWPTSRACQYGYLATQAVDMAVNPDLTTSPNETYELKDEIALRNSTRCGTASAGATTPTLTMSAPAGGTKNIAIAASAITAIVSGSLNASSPITFTLFGPQATAPTTCTSGGTTIGTATPSGDGTYPSSAGWTPTAAGTYWWYASMPADANNNATNSTCGAGMASTVVVVGKSSPTLAVSGPGFATAGAAIPAASIGAVLSGSSGATTGSTISYTVFGPQASAPVTCTSGGTAVTPGSSPTADGTWTPGSGFTPPTTGTYWWYASFSGDTNDNAATSPCGSSMSSTIAVAGLTSLQFFDTNTDGKVDQVKATFSGPISCAAPCTTGWTLSNVPSGGTLASVSIAGSVATLTLSPGAGAADTSAGSFTVALAASANLKDASNNVLTFSSQAPADNAAPVPITVVDTNGATDGKFEAGDTLTVTFSEPVTAAGATSNVVVTGGNGNNPDAVTMSNLLSGSAAITKDYIAGNGSTASFNSSVLSQPAGNQLRVTLASCTGACASLAATAALANFTFTPAATITDAAGNAAAGSKTISVKLF